MTVQEREAGRGAVDLSPHRRYRVDMAFEFEQYVEAVTEAIKHFWLTRQQQLLKQSTSGRKDQGSRGIRDGGAQMDKFVDLLARIVSDAIRDASISARPRLSFRGSSGQPNNGMWLSWPMASYWRPLN